MTRSGRLHTVHTLAAGITLAADNGDFGALIGTAGTGGLVHEIRVWQTGTTTLTMDQLRITRGTLAAGGAALVERDMDPTDTAIYTGVQLPTTDVTADYELHMGWNLLQEFVWLPTPRIQLLLNDGDDLGIGREGTMAHTGVGFSITWEEWTN